MSDASSEPAATPLNVDEYANPIVEWMSSEPIALGVFFIIIGAITAILGKRWFPWISAAYAALCVIEFIVVGSSIAGWWTVPIGVSITLIVAVLASIPVGVVIRRNIWVAVGLIGILLGAYFGFTLYTLILALADAHTLAGMLVLTLVSAVACGALACKYGQEIVLYGTSFIGSYIFMRGWSYIFGGFQSEAEIIANL